MSLHGRPVRRAARLPDGREVEIRVGVAQDPYVAEREIDTVVLELRIGGGVVAVVTTVLGAEHEDEARELAARVADGLASGALAPTASSIEPLADGLR